MRILDVQKLTHDAHKQTKQSNTLPFSFEEEGWQNKALQYITRQMDIIQADKPRFEAYFLGKYAQDPFYHSSSRKQIPRQ